MRIVYWDALCDYAPSEDASSVIADIASDWGFGSHAVCRAVMLPDMRVDVSTDEHDNLRWMEIRPAPTRHLLDLIEQGGQLTDDTVLDLIDENLRLREQIAQHEAALEAIGAGGVSGERIRQRRGA